MNTKRIEMLKKFMQEDPQDPFPVYALALEYQATDPQKARLLFEQLLTNHPDYLPVYYMAGVFFVDQNEIAFGTRILERGLNLAKAQNNQATWREIKGVLDSLE
ncbi:MAG: tetratricopeptide repeat protein [Cyclobacteriaceae bacterium]|nr:tetratricopeptide repeat protein [Cyclobacteriaceae bacterium]